jgi:hypothetical protein
LECIGNPSQALDSAPFANLAGVATNPTAVTLVVERPDLTRLHYGWPVADDDGALTNESPGRFYFDVLIDQPGLWRYRLKGTGAVTAAAEGLLRVSRQRVLP